MIISFDGSRAFSSNRTGTENYSYQLLKALAKIDKKNTYKVFLRPGAVVNRKEWPENFQFITLGFRYLWTQIGLGLQTFVEPMDVLFVPAHTLPLIRAPWVKTVVTVHDLGSEYLPQTHQIKQRLYLSLMQNYQLQTATKLIAVSQATKQDLINKIGIDTKKIEVVHEGYNESLYTSLPIDIQVNRLKQFNLAPKQYFLFVGTVQPRKNLARLIEAIAKYSSSEAKPSREVITENMNKSAESSRLRSNNILVIVGKKGWMSDEIYALPKKLGIEDKVKFLDYVKDEDLPVLYSGASALVYPSLFEGFGLPILEAQACGTPVITSNVSSMPEIAGKGAILVDPYNTDDITDAMIKIQDEKLRMQKIKQGFENIKRFSWEKCAKETLEVLTKI